MPFQINSSQLFLTYPQCKLSKDEVLLQLLGKFPNNLFHYIIAHELHKNGDDHIHAYLKFSEPVRTKSSSFADLVHPDTQQVYHGNYQGCRSAKNVVKYVTKDEDYISDLDVPSIVAGKSSRKAICQKILSGTELAEIAQDHPEIIFGYTKLKLDVQTFKEDMAPRKPSLPTFLPNPWGLVLPSFKKAKKRHYWIYSTKPNLGKTFLFAKPLVEEYRAVIAAGNLSVWNVEVSTQLLILDDYNHAALRYNDLNTICDGTYCFKRAYRGVVQLSNFLVIVLSNQCIKDIYPNMYELLYARFNEIELKC